MAAFNKHNHEVIKHEKDEQKTTMNILIDTKSSLKESLLNYMCMRMKFRGTVLGGEPAPTKTVSAAAESPCVLDTRIKH